MTMTYYAIDPGKVSGVARASIWSTMTMAPEISQVDEIHVDGIYDWLSEYLDVGGIPHPDPRIVIVENFTLHSASTNSSQPDALHIIGAIKFLANKHGFTLVLQPPSNKKFCDNAKLKSLGWHHPSKGQHQNDAIRHIVYYLLFHEMNPWLIRQMENMADPSGVHPMQRGPSPVLRGVEPIIGKSYKSLPIISDPTVPPNTAYYIDPQQIYHQQCSPKWAGWQNYTEPSDPWGDIHPALKEQMRQMLYDPSPLFEQLKKLK